MIILQAYIFEWCFVLQMLIVLQNDQVTNFQDMFEMHPSHNNRYPSAFFKRTWDIFMFVRGSLLRSRPR